MVWASLCCGTQPSTSRALRLEAMSTAGIAGPPGRQLHREVHAGHLPGGFHNLPHRKSVLTAQVEDLALTAPEQVFQCQR